MINKPKLEFSDFPSFSRIDRYIAISNERGNEKVIKKGPETPFIDDQRNPKYIMAFSCYKYPKPTIENAKIIKMIEDFNKIKPVSGDFIYGISDESTKDTNYSYKLLTQQQVNLLLDIEYEVARFYLKNLFSQKQKLPFIGEKMIEYAKKNFLTVRIKIKDIETEYTIKKRTIKKGDNDSYIKDIVETGEEEEEIEGEIQDDIERAYTNKNLLENSRKVEIDFLIALFELYLIHTGILDSWYFDLYNGIPERYDNLLKELLGTDQNIIKKFKQEIGILKMLPFLCYSNNISAKRFHYLGIYLDGNIVDNYGDIPFLQGRVRYYDQGELAYLTFPMKRRNTKISMYWYKCLSSPSRLLLWDRSTSIQDIIDMLKYPTDAEVIRGNYIGMIKDGKPIPNYREHDFYIMQSFPHKDIKSEVNYTQREITKLIHKSQWKRLFWVDCHKDKSDWFTFKLINQKKDKKKE